MASCKNDFLCILIHPHYAQAPSLRISELLKETLPHVWTLTHHWNKNQSPQRHYEQVNTHLQLTKNSSSKITNTYSPFSQNQFWNVQPNIQILSYYSNSLVQVSLEWMGPDSMVPLSHNMSRPSKGKYYWMSGSMHVTILLSNKNKLNKKFIFFRSSVSWKYSSPTKEGIGNFGGEWWVRVGLT